MNTILLFFLLKDTVVHSVVLDPKVLQADDENACGVHVYGRVFRLRSTFPDNVVLVSFFMPNDKIRGQKGTGLVWGSGLLESDELR